MRHAAVAWRRATTTPAKGERPSGELACVAGKPSCDGERRDGTNCQPRTCVNVVSRTRVQVRARYAISKTSPTSSPTRAWKPYRERRPRSAAKFARACILVERPCLPRKLCRELRSSLCLLRRFEVFSTRRVAAPLDAGHVSLGSEREWKDAGERSAARDRREVRRTPRLP